jgi:hypothetical protein
VTNQAAPVAPAAPAPRTAPAAPVAPAPPSPPAVRAPLVEPHGPIDPKSAEAAGQVVQHYGALVEQKRFAQAEKLWSSGATARDFTRQLTAYPVIHLEIGDLGQMEGAAGSSYITEPVVFYGKDSSGKHFRRSADIILRRVNDVPGSTQAQRRWHIERIDWKAGA